MTDQHREALSGLVYSVCTRPGLSVLIGEAGTGKTTILYTLLGLLERRQYLTAMCTNPTLTKEEFYEFVLFRFGVDCPSQSKTRRLFALEEALKRRHEKGQSAVLIIDEAQRLPAELLEEVRLLLNLETPREKLIEIVLAGQPEFADTLRRVELRQLKQRVGCMCSLRPLNSDEVKEYINHRLMQAGISTPTLFSADAIEAVYTFSGGIPRLINTLSDTVMRNGFALQAATITSSIVIGAANELGLWASTTANPKPVEENVVVAALDSKLRENSLPEMPAGSNLRESVPLESYTARQSSLSFFAHLLERWR
jgi:general secretion pathway protein A